MLRLREQTTSPDPVTAGNDLTYYITVVNNGPGRGKDRREGGSLEVHLLALGHGLTHLLLLRRIHARPELVELLL